MHPAGEPLVAGIPARGHILVAGRLHLCPATRAAAAAGARTWTARARVTDPLTSVVAAGEGLPAYLDRTTTAVNNNNNNNNTPARQTAG